jgi:YjbE family integral membrane protein
MPELALDSGFWIGLGQIILVNLILSGDNAVVIALAARSLPEPQRRQAIVLGSLAAVVMRVLLTLVAAEMLKLPYLKLVGAALLFWIAIQLLLPEEGGGDGLESHDNLVAAIRTILLADLVMSLDNVIAVAAAAHGNFALLVLGLGISIPLVVFGSTLVLKLMDSFPGFVVLGAALLGFVAGEMLVTDPALANWPSFGEDGLLHRFIPLAGAVLVVLVGKHLASQRPSGAPPGPVDLAEARSGDSEPPR